MHLHEKNVKKIKNSLEIKEPSGKRGNFRWNVAIFSYPQEVLNLDPV